MYRFLLSAVVAGGVAALSVPQTQAVEHSGHGSGHSFSNYTHSFHASRGFDYGRHGYRSMYWTHSHWSSYYGCYCYWAPTYGWCFYEPSYSCYLPVSYYHQVYPEFIPSGPAPVIASPTTIQQTSVVVGPSIPTAAPVPTPAPVPATVQQTKVVVSATPTADVPPLPSGAPGPLAVPQSKVAAGAP